MKYPVALVAEVGDTADATLSRYCRTRETERAARLTQRPL